MASNNNRDVTMTLSVETLGAENIQKLQATVLALAKEGGAAAPEFQKLADEIGRLGQQAQALKALTDLTDETTDLAARQSAASTNAAELAAKLETLSAATQAAAARQRETADAMNAAQQASRASRDELATLVATTDRAGKTEKAYTDEVERLKVAKIAQRAEVERLAGALAASNTEVREAEKAEAKLGASYSRSQAAAEKAADAVRKNAEAVQRAAESALDLGVSTDNIAGAQAELVRELNRTGRAAGDLKAQVDRLADAERELAGIRAFEEQAEAAQRLQTAGDYARLFDEAIRNLAESERALAQQQADARWQREAEAIVDAAHAAQELARQTRVLEAAQRELAAQRAFEQQAEDARRLIAAAEYVRNWEEQLAAAEKQARETAEAAAAASKKISDAFSTLGVRSAKDLEQEIAKVRAAMRTVEQQAGLTGAQLDTALSAGGERIAELESQLRAVNDEMTLGDQIADLFSNSIGQIAAGNLVADAIGSLVETVKALAVEFVKTIVEAQNLKRALMAVYNDSKLAAAQFDFLKKTANQAGVAIGDIVGAFIKFSAATKASGISLDVTNELFAQVARSAGILGLSGEQVTGMLEALGQMASKGTVSMEELRQQLGDRLPGALSLVAKGLGLTEAELIKLVEAGGLAASDLFPALIDGLQGIKGEATGLSSQYQRFKNILTETAQAAGDAGWANILAGALAALGVVVGALAIAFSFLTEAIFNVIKVVGILVGAIVTLRNPMEDLNDMLTESRQRHDKLTNAILNGITGTIGASAATTALEKSMADAGEKAAALTISAKSTAIALEAQAFAAKLATDGKYKLGAQIIQLKVYLDQLIESQKAQIDQDVKLAKAAKIQGESLVEMTGLRGRDLLSMEAQRDAALKYANALETAATSQRTELELLVLKRDEIIKNTLAQGGNAKTYKVQVDAINEKIAASEAETEQSKQAAEAAIQESAMRTLAIATYKDNSAAVDEFRKAMIAAEESVVKLTEGVALGWATQEQLNNALARATYATHLYNDAIKDSIDAIERENRLKQSSLNLAISKLELEQRNYEALAQAARISGDVANATYYEIAAKLKQIEVIKAVAAAKKLEAEQTIKALEIERAALDQLDPLLKQKQAEIDIRLNNAKAKLLEAAAGLEAIKALDAEIERLRFGENARAKDTKSRQENAKAMDAQTAALKRKNGAQYDENGLALNTEGDVINATTDLSPWRGQNDWNYVDKNGNWRKSQKQPIKDPEGGYMEPGGSQANGSEADRMRNQGMDERTGQSGGGVSSAAPAPETGASRGPTTTVVININGKMTPVNVASGDDAQALTGVLRQLETASGRSA